MKNERRKKIDEVLERRQLSKVQRIGPKLHICFGSGCPICGGT